MLGSAVTAEYVSSAKEKSVGRSSENTGDEKELIREVMREMNDSDVFCANPDFVYRGIAGEYILVPVGKAAERFSGLASLNKTGLFLWKLLGQKRTFRELAAALAKEYELTEEASCQDVTDFLNLAVSKGVVLRC